MTVFAVRTKAVGMTGAEKTEIMQSVGSWTEIPMGHDLGEEDVFMDIKPSDDLMPSEVSVGLSNLDRRCR
jgi:hypothetical protein